MKRPSRPSKRGIAAYWQRQQPLLLSVLLALAVHVALLLLPLAPASGPSPAAVLQLALPPLPPVPAPVSPPAAARPPLPGAAQAAATEQPASAAAGELPLQQAEPAENAPPTQELADVAAESELNAGAASEPWGLALDPYYPAAELDVLAAPIGPLLLDYPRVQPQPLDLQLYISREGMVDKVEVIAGKADSDYARYVLASFLQARFLPAFKDGVAVRSRKHVRVALQP